MIEIRTVQEEDALALLEIYRYYVEETAITFDYQLPSLATFKSRIKQIKEHYPYLVIVKEGTIQGYAYANSLIDRQAYDWSCEVTIYLDKSARGMGMGRCLYQALENDLKDMGILNLYACIAYPEENDPYLTTQSHDFHKHIGYQRVGFFHHCGYKFDTWYHMVWMEKLLGEHRLPAGKILPPSVR